MSAVLLFQKMSKECLYKLRSCVWEITLSCCFSCAYCGSRGGHARENELTTEECLDIAKQLKELGCRRVSLIGGEVFMRDDWDIIVKALTERNIKVCIITNGFTMSKDIINALKDCKIESVAVSLDGPQRAHDKYRQKGSYNRAISAIDALIKDGIAVSAISALRSDNYMLLEELYNTLKNYDIFAWQLQACSPMGFAEDNGIDTKFDAKYVINFVKNKLPIAKFSLGIADNIGYYTKEEGTLRGRNNSYFSGCSAGLTSIGIDSVGNVRGCESMYDDYFIEGNLRNKSLKEIWEDENAFSYNRHFSTDLLSGKCKDCKFGMYCAGGCRSYNYFTNDKKLYENVLCARNNCL